MKTAPTIYNSAVDQWQFLFRFDLMLAAINWLCCVFRHLPSVVCPLSSVHVFNCDFRIPTSEFILSPIPNPDKRESKKQSRKHEMTKTRNKANKLFVFSPPDVFVINPPWRIIKCKDHTIKTLSFFLYCARKKWPQRGSNSAIHWFWVSGVRFRVSGNRGAKS